MVLPKFLLFMVVLAVGLQKTYGHGRMMEPVNRSSAYKKGFATPENYEDNQLYCGGGAKNISNIAAECGVCGDDPAEPQPRPNENGGLHGTGLIVKTYKAGQTIRVTIDVNANHAGHFHFALCPLKSEHDIETEDCFSKHPVYLADGSRRFKVPLGNYEMSMELKLPRKLTCKHCVLRWHWRTGNNWGYCTPEEIRESDTAPSMLPQSDEELYGELGCGPQEIFRGCSDVAIASEKDYTKVLKEVAHKNDIITKRLLAEKAEATRKDEDFPGNGHTWESGNTWSNGPTWEPESPESNGPTWGSGSTSSNGPTWEPESPEVNRPAWKPEKPPTFWQLDPRDNEKCTCTCSPTKNGYSVNIQNGHSGVRYYI